MHNKRLRSPLTYWLAIVALLVAAWAQGRAVPLPLVGFLAEPVCSAHGDGVESGGPEGAAAAVACHFCCTPAALAAPPSPAVVAASRPIDSDWQALWPAAPQPQPVWPVAQPRAPPALS